MVGDNQARKKRLRGGGRKIKHPELEILLPSWIKEHRQKCGARVTIKNTVKKGNSLLKEMGREGEVKYGAIWRMKDRNGLALRRKSTENQYKPDDLIPKCQRFCLFMKHLFEKHEFSQVIAMDETLIFADNMGSTTLEIKGTKEVRMQRAGNSKKFQSLLLSINSDGTKNKPCVVLKVKENQLRQRLCNKERILECSIRIMDG